MRTIATDAAPKAIGPYSQAIAIDRLVFTAGQVALDPKSGELVGKTTAEQTEQVFANLKAVLSAAGTSLASDVPAADSTALRFANTCSVCSAVVLPTSSPLFGSRAT